MTSQQKKCDPLLSTQAVVQCRQEEAECLPERTTAEGMMRGVPDGCCLRYLTARIYNITGPSVELDRLIAQFRLPAENILRFSAEDMEVYIFRDQADDLTDWCNELGLKYEML